MSEFTNGRYPSDVIRNSEIVPGGGGGVKPGATVLSQASRDQGASSGMRAFLAGVVLLLAVTLGGRWWMIESDVSPILTYQSMIKPLEKAVYFQPDTARPGETVQLVFNRTKWFNTTYKDAYLIFSATCWVEVERDGKPAIEERRRDYPAYPINVPPNPLEVPTKSRPFEVPTECLPGTLAYRAFARHHRGLLFSDKETHDFPEVFLTVLAR